MINDSNSALLSAFAFVERERNPRLDALAPILDPAEIAAFLTAEREAIIQRIRQADRSPLDSRTGTAIARDLSDLMDATLTRLFHLACSRVGNRPEAVQIAIVATGGYGRRELCPFSDVDVTFIPQRDNDPTVDRVIREMFTLVMDVCIARCGLEVGYAYRLLDDCGSLDHQTACGLLDARLIVGNDRLFIQFEDAFWAGFNPVDFIFTKLKERDRVLERWGTLPRVVEPNVKEGPGGLRDLQCAVWLVQARRGLVAARARGDRSFEALAREAAVPADEVAALLHAKELIFRVRNALHAATGAHRDELVITRQEEIAEMLGYGAPTGLDSDGNGHDSDATPHEPPVERFMADLYPAMALVRRVSVQVMRRIANSRLILGIGLDCKRREIVPANGALETDDPSWLLWACELAQQYELEFGEGIEHAAVELIRMCPILTEPSMPDQVFTRMLGRTGRVYPILQRMSDLGILGWFLPEFGATLDLIPYDPSHDFTVGQHTLLVVRHIEALLTREGEEWAEMRRVLEELPHPEQLVLATLLHDTGKGMEGRPHAEVGEEIAKRVCRRLGWSDEAARNVRFLVRNHLLMAETSRLRDLNLEETIRDFVREVDDLDRLNMLYLLTYADTRAVGEGIWTQVKGRFLRDLWRRAAGRLTEEEPDAVEATVDRARRRLLKDLSLERIPEEEVREHVQAMPPEYLLNQDPKQIALHIGFIRRVRAGEIVIDFHDERDATYTELTVCLYDDPEPGLLAKITGALHAANLDVHSAQVITRVTEADRIALDTLWVDFRGRQLTPGKRREVTANLNDVLSSAESLENVVKRRRKTSVTPASRSRLIGRDGFVVRSIRNDLSDSLTFLEIGGPDIQATLFRVCEAMSKLGWDIRSARTSTWKGEARVSLYVASARNLSESDARNALSHVLPRRT